jgi:hypothetical protein
LAASTINESRDREQAEGRREQRGLPVERIYHLLEFELIKQDNVEVPE